MFSFARWLSSILIQGVFLFGVAKTLTLSYYFKAFPAESVLKY